MKKIVLLLIFLLNFTNSFGQCLCGKFEIQIYFDDLVFLNGNSNYELKFLEKPKSIHYTSGRLKETVFSKDTLKISLSTDAGIQKLVIQLKNIHSKSTMNLAITNMTYDNYYFIDVGNYIKGNYRFNWDIINKCQSENKTNKSVNCNGIKFKQLELLSMKEINSGFNHNKIKVADINSFLYVK